MRETKSSKSAKIISLNSYPVKNVLHKLIADKTTGRNIIFATDNYMDHGRDDTDQITVDALLGFESIDIQPRVMKCRSEQTVRTQKKAEVFTPTWIVRKMNDFCDSIWHEEKLSTDWRKYVSLRILEITCGEAPFLVTRYDMTTGDLLPLYKRTGMLDRKLQAIQANDETTWLKWAFRAYETTYGYEFQGDNLLIARINLLVTFCDYLEDRWERKATDSELGKLANIIAWNIWQMDGLKETVPIGIPKKRTQLSLIEDDEEKIPVACTIYNWTAEKDHCMIFSELKKSNKKMTFDFVIGNPPYQEESAGGSNTATPIYNLFMNSSYAISSRVLLITPARFLFNAGYTPKDWNKKMLTDPHFKVVYYDPNSAEVFSEADIKGGIAITYRDESKDYGAIETFTRFDELDHIFHHITKQNGFESISDIIVTSFAYHFTKLMYDENPTLVGRSSKGHEFDLQSNAFDTFPEIFIGSAPEDEGYIRILGRVKNKRCYRYISERYVKHVSNLDNYKVFIAKAAGTGLFGEVLPDPIMGYPKDGATVTFLSIGHFTTETEAANCIKYICTKFARTLLGVLKVTQDLTPSKWKYVPLQDFTERSDIDWSKSVAEIDKQLYRKYGLTQEEIDFIESHVNDME